MVTSAPHTVSATPGRSAPRRILGQREFCLAFGGLLLSSAFFWLFPDVDLDMSELFYRKAGGFFLAHDHALELVRRIGTDLSWAYGLLAVGLMVAGLVLKAHRGELIRRGAFLTGVMLIGPGILVNLVLKDNWGRARPRNLVEFGGTLPYSKVWEIVPYCKTNCSFVSGEAAAAFALLATVWIVPERYRLKLAVPLLALVSLISLDRVMFGGHFLSDTLLSWMIVLIVILVLDRLILQRKADRVLESLRGWFRTGPKGPARPWKNS